MILMAILMYMSGILAAINELFQVAFQPLSEAFEKLIQMFWLYTHLTKRGWNNVNIRINAFGNDTFGISFGNFPILEAVGGSTFGVSGDDIGFS